MANRNRNSKRKSAIKKDNINNQKNNNEQITNEKISTEEKTHILISESDFSKVDDKISEEEPTNKKVLTENPLPQKPKLYLGYNGRLIISIIVFVVSLIVCFFLANKAFKYEEPKVVNYNEKGALNYRVYLKENNFYETNYLDENMIYVANLIDNINLDFNYDFNIEEPTELTFTYQVLADLVISSQNGNSNFLEKTYNLTTEKTLPLNNQKDLNINENIKIDYDYYNSIANNYKAMYSVDTNSYLRVYVKVNKKNNETDEVVINDSNEMASIMIPLSQRAVEFTLNTQNTDSNNKAVSDSKLIFNSNNFAIELVFAILAIVSLVKIIKLLVLLTERKNSFDKYVLKLLKEYDRLIVETTTGLDFSKYNRIKVKSFEELLDVRDNLKLPIMYYNVSKHNKCYFYIKHDNDVYMVTIKEIDLEGK